MFRFLNFNSILISIIPVGKLSVSMSISIVDLSVKLDLCMCMVMVQGVVYLFRYLLHWTPMTAL